MNIYIVHSGCDKDAVMKVTSELEKREESANVLMLKNGGVLWKLEAIQLLKKSQMVLFIVGKDSHKSKNIDWELKKAIKYHKLVLYHKLDDKNKLNKCLVGKDPFSKREIILAENAATVEAIVDRLRRYENNQYAIFNNEIQKINRTELLEQYKVFLETSESLIARRQTVNSFYVSANTALITIMGALIAVLNGTNERIIMFILISLVGIILSLSWNRILNSYGILNGSKMRVISMIERELPAALYDTEWNVMSDKLNSRKYISFTDSEKKAPKAFIALYILLILIAVFMAKDPLLQWLGYA